MWSIFSLSLLIRVSLVFFYGNPDHPQLYEHGEIAHNLYTGHGFSMHWPYEPFDSARKILLTQPPQHEGAFLPPLNPYIIYGSYLVFGENRTAYIAVMLLYAILSAGITIMVYKTALMIGNEQRSRIAAIICTLFLPSAYAAITFSGSVLYQLLGVVIFYFAFKLIHTYSIKNAILYGFLCGVMTMLRSEFFFLGFLLIIAATLVPLPHTEVRKRVVLCCSSLLVFVAVISPWTIRNYGLFGQFVPVLSHPWYEMWRGNNPQATGTTHYDDGRTVWVTPQAFPKLIRQMDSLPYDTHFELATDQILKREVLSFVFHEPFQFLRLGIKKIAYFLTVDFSDRNTRNPIYMVLMIGVILSIGRGYIRLLKSPLTTEKVIITLFILSYVFLTIMTVMLSRYQIYFYQVLLPIMATSGVAKMGKPRIRNLGTAE